MIDFTRFKALTFDCYGTLIDWERGILNVLRPWATRLGVEADNERRPPPQSWRPRRSTNGVDLLHASIHTPLAAHRLRTA